MLFAGLEKSLAVCLPYMKFEWDVHKDKLNRKRHHVSFENAVRVFCDAARIVRFDEGHSDHEDRWITIGMAYPALLLVVYTERQGGEVYRIISARKANAREQREYDYLRTGR